MISRTVLVLALVILVIVWFVFLRNNLQIKLALWGISADLKGFQIKELPKSFKDHQEYLELSDGKNIIKIVKTVSGDHKKFIDDKIVLFSTFYEPYTSPYPEAISDKVVCPKEFMPVKIPIKSGRAYRIYAGERFNYGVCVKNLIKYKSSYAIFDCNSKGIFEVNTFSKDSFMEDIITSFSCDK